LLREQYRKIAEHIIGMKDPENHEATVALFAKLHKACGFPKLVKVGEAYPDILAIESLVCSNVVVVNLVALNDRVSFVLMLGGILVIALG